MTTPLPKLTRPRRDGWTPEVQQRFLDELAVSASPAKAAAAAGRSMQSAYKLRARAGGAAFRDGWAAALTSCMLQVREQAVERAFHGYVEPIIKRGRKVGERQVFNNGMLLAMMRLYDAPAFHADRARAEAVTAAAVPLTPDELVAQFAAGLAQLAHKDFAQVEENAKEALLQRLAFDSPSVCIETIDQAVVRPQG